MAARAVSPSFSPSTLLHYTDAADPVKMLRLSRARVDTAAAVRVLHTPSTFQAAIAIDARHHQQVNYAQATAAQEAGMPYQLF